VVYKGSSGFKNALGQKLADNAVWLKELRVVQPRLPKSVAKVKNDDE
jgi:hypothetical protein